TGELIGERDLAADDEVGFFVVRLDPLSDEGSAGRHQCIHGARRLLAVEDTDAPGRRRHDVTVAEGEGVFQLVRHQLTLPCCAAAFFMMMRRSCARIFATSSPSKPRMPPNASRQSSLGTIASLLPG